MEKMGSVRMEVQSDGLAIITFRNPPVNALSMHVLQGLKHKFLEATHRNDVKAIVLRGEEGKFSGGFDINGLLEAQKTGIPIDGNLSLLGDVSVDIMLNTIEAAKKPSVAAIEGLALGGGLELAMACHARISAPKAQLGLPELQLGIIPGFGGTQRLPRLIGLSKAIDMMLYSKTITSEEAKKLGLVDAVVEPVDLLHTARSWALDIAEHQRPWITSLQKTDKLGPLEEARQILRSAKSQAKKKTPNVPHPFMCLDAIEEGVVAGNWAGILKEQEYFKKSVVSDSGKALVHIFLAQRATSKVPGVSDLGLKPRPVKVAAVVGGGLMGSGIATSLILSNIPVLMKEVNEDFLQQGINRVKGNLLSKVRKGNMTQEKFDKTISLLKGVLDYNEFSKVDLVIEAVIESIPLKQQIFSDLEKICPPHCVLATNTSSIDLNFISEKTASKERILGAHFFSPAHVMPLVEIVRTERTSPQVIIDLMNIAKIIKKVPVVVGNCTGFAVNRVFFPFSHSAHLLADLGVDVYQIDNVITAFGMPMGPFRLTDLIGHELSVNVGGTVLNAFPERSYMSQLIPLMMKDKRLGEKNGKGFYLYDSNRKARPDPDLKRYMDRSRELANIMPQGKPISITDKEILEMILFPVVNEACRVLDEGIAVKASDLDIASVLGCGFPAYRGGVVFWGDSVGASYIYKQLKTWSEAFGSFFRPSSYLEQRATQGILLSAPANDTNSRM